MIKIPYGEKDFKKIITEGYYYIDKTMYIERLEEVGCYLVYLRPRRFGKSLFLSMLECYYDIKRKDEYDRLFKGTYVYKTEFKKKNSYYILNFDFSGIETINIDTIMRDFREKVIRGIKKFIAHYELKIVIDYNKTASNILADLLGEFQNLNLDNKIYVLIDEYDEFTNAILKGDAKEFSDLLTTDGYVRCFYAVLKTYAGTVIDRMFITGVCSVSLDSMTSGFNIALNLTTDKRFNAMIGFTHEEVKAILESSPKKEEIFNIMKDNFNGYMFNEDIQEKVFASTLVMYFLNYYSNVLEYPKNLIDPNIIPNYDKIMSIISLSNNKYYNEIISDIYDDRKITGELKTALNILYKDANNNIIFDISRDDIISLLFYFGYITIEGVDIGNDLIYRVPNYVMESIYNKLYLHILNEYNFKYEKNELKDCIKCLSITGNIIPLRDYINKLLESTNKEFFIKFNENSLQSIYYSFLSLYPSVFVTKVEFNLNNGRSDLVIINKDSSNYSVLIEFKYLKSLEKLTDKVIEEARGQVERYRKDNILPDKTRCYIIINKLDKLEHFEEVK